MRVSHYLYAMEGKANLKNYFIVIKWMGPIVCLLLWVSPAFSIGEVYQWTDSRGVIHFSDNLNSVPVALRESPQLIVRRDLFVHETLAGPAAQQQYPQESRFEPTAPQSHPVEFNPTIIYSPQTTTNIVVVNSGFRRVRRRPFPVHRHHGPSFERKFKSRQYLHEPSRQYLHPETHSGSRRQYIHPEASRQPRPSHRRGFAGRRYLHRRAITGRRR